MIYGKPVVLVSFVLLFDVCRACPTYCVCKWKSGKQTVECNDRDLLIIPEGMDSGTQVLEFSGNNLHALHNEKFLKLDLINLQRIYLSRCRIRIIDDRAFKGLTNLVELDLSGNMLENVPSETFPDCPSLMRLTLSGNPVKALRKAAFNHLSFLSTLELSNCELSRVEEGAFQGLPNLEWLHLDGNRLTSLGGLGALSGSLKGIELQNNPWECDCRLAELHDWLAKVNVALTLEPICNGPSRLQGRAVKSVAEDELACLPDVSPTTFYLEIGEGKNVSLLCNVKAVPPAKVSWWFQGQLLQNDSIVAPGMHLLYYIEEGTTEKQSELLIFNANAEDNGTFVCSAENAAGTSQSNFTIRIVIKHVNTDEIDVLPVEHVIVLMAAAMISVLVLVCVIVIFAIKCSRIARKPKRRTKVESLSKDTLLLQETEAKTDLKQLAEVTTHSDEEMLISSPPLPTTTPSSSQPEQNPDLINGMERLEGDGKCAHQKAVELQRALFSYSPDVHLSPVGLFCPEGGRVQQQCYKTLPYNRRQSANRYPREAEFLVRASASPASYEHYYTSYATDVRYTVDGYPARIPSCSAPESVAAPCCSGAAVQWPPCVVAPPSKKSVGAQTHQIDCDETTDTSCASTKPVNKPLCGVTNYQEALTESPDEGYEGESVEAGTS